MCAQLYYLPVQTEGRRKAFFEWKSIDLSSKLSFATCGGNVDYHKSVDHSVLTVPVGTGKTLSIVKSNQKVLFSN